MRFSNDRVMNIQYAAFGAENAVVSPLAHAVYMHRYKLWIAPSCSVLGGTRESDFFGGNFEISTRTRDINTAFSFIYIVCTRRYSKWTITERIYVSGLICHRARIKMARVCVYRHGSKYWVCMHVRLLAYTHLPSLLSAPLPLLC